VTRILLLSVLLATVLAAACSAQTAPTTKPVPETLAKDTSKPTEVKPTCAEQTAAVLAKAQQAIKAKPESVLDLLDAGMAYYAQGKVDDAKKQFRVARSASAGDSVEANLLSLAAIRLKPDPKQDEEEQLLRQLDETFAKYKPALDQFGNVTDLKAAVGIDEALWHALAGRPTSDGDATLAADVDATVARVVALAARPGNTDDRMKQLSKIITSLGKPARGPMVRFQKSLEGRVTRYGLRLEKEIDEMMESDFRANRSSLVRFYATPRLIAYGESLGKLSDWGDKVIESIPGKR
jgi:tetratricopeptide (TPR) repeat protein